MCTQVFSREQLGQGSPFHEGERSAQEHLKLRDTIELRARAAIRKFMPEQHRAFFRQLSYVAVGSVDKHGQPWASLLVGLPGFIDSPDEHHLTFRTQPLPGDPLREALRPGAFIGLLGIELSTRRRNRVNGIVQACDSEGFTVRVDQSFGNCPRYIQARDVRLVVPAGEPRIVNRADRLNDSLVRLITRADTLFIATAFCARETGESNRYGVDVSHRGGRPGFVRVERGRTLTIPDFAGNRFFNTIGNLLVNPLAGLLFIDFECGDLVHIAADAEVLWEDNELLRFAGSERFVRLCIREVVRVENSLPLRWGEPRFSPLLGRTGTWADTTAETSVR